MGMILGLFSASQMIQKKAIILKYFLAFASVSSLIL